MDEIAFFTGLIGWVVENQGTSVVVAVTATVVLICHRRILATIAWLRGVKPPSGNGKCDDAALALKNRRDTDPQFAHLDDKIGTAVKSIDILRERFDRMDENNRKEHGEVFAKMGQLAEAVARMEPILKNLDEWRIRQERNDSKQPADSAKEKKQ